MFMSSSKFFDLVKNLTVDIYDGDFETAEFIASLAPSKITLFSSKTVTPSATDALSIQNLTMPSSASMTSADVCMLDRAAIKTLAVRYPSDAQYVMARIRLSSSWILGFMGLIRRVTLGRIRLGGFTFITDKHGNTTCWLIIKRTKKTTPANRLLLPKSVGIRNFLNWLKSNKINYVVPRFYEQLPELHRDGGDLDLLVADEHADQVINKIRSFSDQVTPRLMDSVPIGMHSISLAAGIPYYPPQLAIDVLNRAIDGPSGSRIPTPIDDLHMFIYHSLYHSKGYSAGIPSIYDGKLENPPENDYFKIIQRKAEVLEIQVGQTMEDLDHYMSQVGWQPRRDTLAKISERNAWVRDHFFGDAPPSFTGLTLFILKEYAVSQNLTSKVVDVMMRSGVRIVDVMYLSSYQKERAIREIRGGNWTGPGRSTNGLFPASFIIGVDPKCIGLKSKHAYQYERFWSKVHKEKVRAAFDVEGEASIVHAADNTFEAQEYLDACLEETTKQKLFEKIDETMSGFKYTGIKRLFSYRYISHLLKFNLRDFAVKKLS